MKCKLKDFCTVINGRAYSQKELLDKGKYRVLRVGNFFSSDRWYFSDLELPAEKYCNKGDLLFAWACSFGPRIWNGEDRTIFHYHIWKLDIDSNIVDKMYLFYLLKISVDSMTAGTHGSVMMHITKSDMENFEFDIPTLEVQKKIAAILSALDEKIAINRAINENLERQAQAFFQELFVDNADPEWAIGTINDLGAVVGGSTPSKAKPEYYTETGIAWITPKDLSVNKSKFISHGENDITELGLKNSSATIMPEGTVLFSSRAPIGYIAVAAGEVATNQGFKSIVPKPEIGTAFVYYFLKHNLPIIEGMASGSTFKEVSGSTMKGVPAVIPDTDTIARFNDFCSPIFAQQRILEEQNHSLAALRDILLPKLMSGEVDVSDIQL